MNYSVSLKSLYGCIIALVLCMGTAPCPARGEALPDLILARVPADGAARSDGGGVVPPWSRRVGGTSIIRWRPSRPGASPVSLTREFHAACDPSVSPDGKNVLFSGKLKEKDPWRIWSMDADGGNKKPITDGGRDCFSPLGVGTLFYLNDKAPVPQITYVANTAGGEQPPRLALFAANADGSNERGISFNRASDFQTDVLPNGRLVFSSVKPGPGNDTALLAVNIDGTDLAAYGEPHPGFKEGAHVGLGGKRVYYIESREEAWPGGGDLAFVETVRPLRTRRLLTGGSEGAFLGPCTLPGGLLAASFRSKGPGGVFALHEVDSNTGRIKKKLLELPGFHLLDAKVLMPRKAVRGRSSIVGFRHKDTGVLFNIDSRISTVPALKNAEKGTVKTLRVIKGGEAALAGEEGERLLGDAPVEFDGSFHIRVPSQVPLRFLLLDGKGKTLAEQRTWTWVMPGESRGCIGCHEDPERVPPNRLTEAIVKPEVRLPPPSGATP